MAREIVINSAPFETRVALVEKQRLIEIFIERARDRGVAGNIYKGRVTRVLPGMQAAFVDIGLEKAAFLHGSDLYAELGEEFIAEDGATPIEVEADATAANGKAAARRVPIEDRLKKGQEILVQVAKQPIGSKGARITGVISLPGRHLVFTPASITSACPAASKTRRSGPGSKRSSTPSDPPRAASSSAPRVRAHEARDPGRHALPAKALEAHPAQG